MNSLRQNNFVFKLHVCKARTYLFIAYLNIFKMNEIQKGSDGITKKLNSPLLTPVYRTVTAIQNKWQKAIIAKSCLLFGFFSEEKVYKTI